MKRVFTLLAALIFILSGEVFAIPYDFYGGVADEIEYSEYVFLSGTPVKMVGTYSAEQTTQKTAPSTHQKVSHTGKKADGSVANTTTTTIETYSFKLAQEDKPENTLTRRMTFETKWVEQKDVRQSTGNTKLTSWSESVTLDGVKYELTNYFFSKANTNDLAPIADFYKGAIKSRRVYSIGGNQGTATISTTGHTTGYLNLWGNAETVKLESSILVKKNSQGNNQGGNQAANFMPFKGSYTVNVADAHTVSMQYDENEGEVSSIKGSNILVERYDAISKYTYMLPSGKGEVSLHKEKMPFLKSLIATKFRDVEGIPEQDAIEKLSSMIKQIDNGVGVFFPNNDTVLNDEQDAISPANETVTEDTSDIFHPRGRLTRIDFIRAFVNLSNIRHALQTEPSALRIVKDREADYNHRNENRHKQKGIYSLNYENYFLDIKDSHPDYELIENGVKSGVIKGRKRTRFRPDAYITKDEMATFFIRALGMENRAPNPEYFTKYSDDASIDGWSKDAIYVATELGIFKPDENGNFNPKGTVTRAEGAEILMRYVEFLEKDLKEHYSDLVKY